MAVTAKLTVRLLAEEIVVAESFDAALWQDVLAAINSGASALGGGSGRRDDGGGGEEDEDEPKVVHGSTAKRGGGIAGLAHELGVRVDQVEGACAPSKDPPYVQLDAHCWEALKRNTPARGPGSISPIALAATVLAIWFKHAGIDASVTVAQCQQALDTMSLRDANASRGLRGCEWLKVAGNSISINPAQRSKAIRIVAAFCTKSAPSASDAK